MFERLSQLATTKPQVLGIVALAFFLFALLAPRFANPLFEKIENWGVQLSGRPSASILCIAGAAILLRLCFLLLIPVPVPEIHDEFSYLLAADTYAHGRLTNPQHPLSVFFDTFHVNQQPTYMSKYPPAQGAVLAVGQLLGHPWIGVLLSMGLMCGAVVWALRGWLPARWAFLAGIFCLLKLGVSSYWVDSYWGGSVAAIGGALAVGALPRMVRFGRTRDAAVLAVGVSILANSRPFEGIIFCAPIAIYLIVKLATPAVRKRLPRYSLWKMSAVAGSVLAVCVAFMAYNNWRVTGDALLFPYSLNNKVYFTTPSLIWQKLEPPKHYANPQFENYYNDGYARRAWRANRADTLPKALHIMQHDAIVILHFYLWPAFFLPLIVLIPLLRDCRTRFFWMQGVVCFAGYILVIWPLLPHYSAPLTAGIFGLVAEGARHIRRWEPRGRPVGIALTRAMTLAAAVLCPFNLFWVDTAPSFHDRAEIMARLAALPGKQLVLVHYPEDHWPEGEWVYNGADIDHSKVVWAREIPGLDLSPLLTYFKDRQVWEVTPGPPKTSLEPYPTPR